MSDKSRLSPEDMIDLAMAMSEADADSRSRALASCIHETLDRTMIAADFWQKYILESALLKHDADLRAEAERIGDALGAFYQRVGQRMPD